MEGTSKKPASTNFVARNNEINSCAFDVPIGLSVGRLQQDLTPSGSSDITMPKRKFETISRKTETCRTKDFASDLMVVLPKISSSGSSSTIESKLLIQEIKERLTNTGFTCMALTHIIFGRPRPNEDSVDVAIPESLWETSSSANVKRNNVPLLPSNANKQPITVLRRLHNVIENLSDVGIYAYQSSGSQLSSKLLNDYDILSISPRNEAVFQAACKSATLADIITLDYSAGRGGLKLPFKIRSSDVRAVIERNAVFEIPFAPALLHEKQRKGLVQTCRELQMASLGLKPRVLLSSGDRTKDDSDVSAMALRVPEDLINLCQTVLRFDANMARASISATGLHVVNRARERRWGRTDVKSAAFEPIDKANPLESKRSTSNKNVQRETLQHNSPSSDDDEIDDGFIAMD